MERGGRQSVVLNDIHTVATTGSTNADVLELARTGAPEGLWLRADRQTSGRGRLGRPWHSPVGNLYASTIVRLRPGDPAAATLGLVAAVALYDAVASGSGASPLALMLKWPNDLMLAGGKLSGILLERIDNAVVIGFGINLAEAPRGLGRATASLGAIIAPDAFLTILAEAFARSRDSWRERGLAGIVAAWCERAHPPGTPLDVRAPDGSTQRGAFARLSAGGALVLRLANGTERVIHTADVFLV